MKANKTPETLQLVIFGGTGNLSRSKLFPSLYSLFRRGELPENLTLLGLGRRYSDESEYLNALSRKAKSVLDNYSKEIWQEFSRHISYQRFDFRSRDCYRNLKKKLKKADDSSASLTSNLIFYLAAAPQHFGTITEFLAKYGLLKSETENWPRVVFEKPFGYDLDSAVRYNKQVRNFVPEENIYRIDHYLGKQMIQNIFVIRFANALFEPVWNRNHIDNIQIISTEKGGVKKRGKYYDEAGAMRDMMQSHLLQMLAMVSMEPPADMTPECIRREKIKIFKSLASPHPENIENELVLGQYVSGSLEGNSVQSYRDEPDIRKDSLTETFAAFKLYIDSLRWQGVPFYLKTGKRLAEKRAEIIVEFEPSFHPALEKNLNPDHSNILRMTVQPKEGVSLQFNAKKPGKKHKTIPVNMDFCQNCKKDFNSPAAYEEIFTGLFRGDQSLFTHWQEIKHSWQFIDNVKKSAEKADIPIISYDAGTRGPIEADRILEKDGRGWWDKVKSYENL